MDKAILEKLKSKPAIPGEIKTEIVDKCTLFGSHAFGGSTLNSDIDYIVPSDFPYGWIELTKYGVVNHVNDYSNLELASIYVKTNSGSILNLIFVHDNFYEIYIRATKIMYGLTFNAGIYNLIQNKTNRIKLFECIKDMLIKEKCNNQ